MYFPVIISYSRDIPKADISSVNHGLAGSMPSVNHMAMANDIVNVRHEEC